MNYFSSPAFLIELYGPFEKMIATIQYVCWESTISCMSSIGLPKNEDVKLWKLVVSERKDLNTEQLEEFYLLCDEYIAAGT